MKLKVLSSKETAGLKTSQAKAGLHDYTNKNIYFKTASTFKRFKVPIRLKYFKVLAVLKFLAAHRIITEHTPKHNW